MAVLGWASSCGTTMGGKERRVWRSGGGLATLAMVSVGRERVVEQGHVFRSCSAALAPCQKKKDTVCWFWFRPKAKAEPSRSSALGGSLGHRVDAQGVFPHGWQAASTRPVRLCWPWTRRQLLATRPEVGISLLVFQTLPSKPRAMQRIRRHRLGKTRVGGHWPITCQRYRTHYLLCT